MFIFNSTLNMFCLHGDLELITILFGIEFFSLKWDVLQMYHIINIPEPFALNIILLFNGQRIFVIRITFKNIHFQFICSRL